MITHLLYLSEQSDVYKPKIDIERILEKSRANNRKKKISGILIQKNKFFLQLIEGDQEKLKKVYELIMYDPRHKNVRLLMEFNSPKRIFPDWSMGHVDLLKTKNVKLSQLIPMIHKDILAMPGEREKVLNILKNFNNI